VLEENGFEVVWTMQNPMHLLEWRRVVADEGWGGFLRIVWRMLRNPTARKRVLQMRSIFRKHADNINAISIVARKKA
jgi:SAM-dependent methyltransferase